MLPRAGKKQWSVSRAPKRVRSCSQWRVSVVPCDNLGINSELYYCTNVNVARGEEARGEQVPVFGDEHVLRAVDADEHGEDVRAATPLARRVKDVHLTSSNK